MTSEENREAVTISLGMIEMNLRDLISLRPGSEICFDFENGLAGVLLVAGCDWAKFSAEIKERDIVLRITEMNAL